MSFMIRQDWLDALGLSAPPPPHELMETMKAFQENDVNQSGEADEVLSISLSDFSSGLSNFYGIGRTMSGELTYCEHQRPAQWSLPGTMENIQSYIEFVKSLVDAGYVDTSDQLDEKKAENKIAGLFDWAGETWQEVGITVPGRRCRRLLCPRCPEGQQRRRRDGALPVLAAGLSAGRKQIRCHQRL